MNPWLRLLLGSGRLPDQIRAELAHDDVVLLEEGLVASVTRRHYRAPIGQTFPLERASDVHAAIEARTTLGKTLLVVR